MFMSTLRDTLEKHAQEFAAAVLQALRGASLDELTGIAGTARTKTSGADSVVARTKSNGARLGRRSADDIAHTLQRFVSLLKHHPEGLRAEQLRELLFLDKRELPRPIAEGLQTGALVKTGQKRATVYTLGAGARPPQPKTARKKAVRKKGAAKK